MYICEKTTQGPICAPGDGLCTQDRETLFGQAIKTGKAVF